MADTSIPDPAARVGFYVATMDKGDGVELRLEDVSRILHGFPGEDKCRSALRGIVLSGWVTRTPGGRDHGDTFRWAGADRVGPQPQAKHSLPVLSPGYVDLGSGHSPTLSDSVGVQPQAISSLLLPSSYSCSSTDARARMSPDAERVMEERNEVLDGCRGPLADYLAARVDPDKQAPYVWRVVASLEGSDEWMWKDRAGHALHNGRTGILAGAFNELLAGDETGKHFAEPPGGYGNLRTKVRYLVASSLGVDSDATKAKGPPKGGAHPHLAIPSNQGSLD